ncbi:MAG: DNA polymerase III subunit gamma/tau [Candidatus Limnocylindrales bacterium]
MTATASPSKLKTGGTPPSEPHLAISRRWRAQTFSQIVGQTAVVETLRNATRLGRVGHAYLFVGPRGTGKTSMARILAKAVNCTNLRDGEPCDACPSCVAIREGTALDVAEFDAASNNTVSDMRELLPRVHTAPADLRRKVFIVDEVQRIKEGWDVLLKTLEEPPPHVLFIFCTTDPTQIRPAVLSRVQRFTFRPLTVDQIAGKLDRILSQDGRTAEPEAVRLVAELAAGGMRDAESMLDQLLSSAADPLTADEVRAQLGLAAASEVDSLLAALLAGDALEGVRVLDRLEVEGRDLRLVTDQAIERLRRVLFARLASEPVAPAFGSPALAELAAAARELASIDATRAGGGRQRLALELLLLGRSGRAAAVEAPARAAVSTIAPASVSAGAPAGSGVSAANVAARPAREDAVARGAEARRDAAVPVPAAGGSEAARGHGRPPSASLRQAEAVPRSPEGSPGAAVVPSPQARRPLPADAGASGPASGASEAPGSAPLAETSSDLLGRVRTGWPEIVAALSRMPLIKPLVEVCRPVRLEGRVVILGFPEDKAFLREKAEQRHAAFEAAIEAAVGTQVGIRCVATNLEALPPLPHEVIGRENLDAARRVFAGELADAADVE